MMSDQTWLRTLISRAPQTVSNDVKLQIVKLASRTGASVAGITDMCKSRNGQKEHQCLFSRRFKEDLGCDRDGHDYHSQCKRSIRNTLWKWSWRMPIVPIYIDGYNRWVLRQALSSWAVFWMSVGKDMCKRMLTSGWDRLCDVAVAKITDAVRDASTFFFNIIDTCLVCREKNRGFFYNISTIITLIPFPAFFLNIGNM